MNIGTFLGHGGTVFTPWIRRGGDNAVFTFEVIDNPDGVAVTFTVYTKNQDDYGAGALVDDAERSSEGFEMLDLGALEEMVRFSITVAYPEEGGSGTGIVYRILDPTW